MPACIDSEVGGWAYRSAIFSQIVLLVHIPVSLPTLSTTHASTRCGRVHDYEQLRLIKPELRMQLGMTASGRFCSSKISTIMEDEEEGKKSSPSLPRR